LISNVIYLLVFTLFGSEAATELSELKQPLLVLKDSTEAE